MKAKSLKLRMLVMLKTLFKNSDEKHRMNSVDLNNALRPYGLECSCRVLQGTAAALREFGVDLRSSGKWDRWGVWIGDRPLSEKDLQGLIFSVATNPYLSKEQATAQLRLLSPFVTVYQEPMLQSCVEDRGPAGISQEAIDAFSVVQEALRCGRRIRFTLKTFVYDKVSPTGVSEKENYTLFTPKCLYRGKRSIYVVGYNHSEKCVESVDLRSVLKAEIAGKHHDPHEAHVREVLQSVEPKDYFPGEQKPIYIGPAVFCCRSKHLGELISMFGVPDGKVEKDNRKRCVFCVQKVEIWPETLVWLSGAPEDHAIQIKGPEGLVDAVNAYCDDAAQKSVLAARRK